MANQLNHLFAALADPTRLAVVEQLAQGPLSVSALHNTHQMALPTFTKHLSKLEAAGLIRSVKKGRVRTIHIEAQALSAVETWINQQRALWDGRLDALTTLAEATASHKTPPKDI